MNKINYPLASSTWGIEEQEAAIDCILSGNLTMGVKVKEFEKLFADKLGSRFAVMVNSGSSANLLMLSAMRYSEALDSNKNEIIVPAVSWSTTYFPISQNNFKLKFIKNFINLYNRLRKYIYIYIYIYKSGGTRYWDIIKIFSYLIDQEEIQVFAAREKVLWNANLK